MGYGEDETITSNCHVQNAYAPNRIETAEHLSKMAGQTTIVKEDVSINMSQGGGLFSGLSKNKSLRESQRELITPDECMRLKLPVKDGANIIEPGEMLIFVAGYPAIRGVQPLYFKDPVYLKRAQVTTPAILIVFDYRFVECNQKRSMFTIFVSAIMKFSLNLNHWEQ